MKKYLAGFKLPFNKAESGHAEDDRHATLELALPRLTARPKQLDLNAKRLLTHLGDYANERVQQISEAIRFLDQINHADIKIGQRLELTDTTLQSVGHSIFFLYRKYISKGGGFPEDQERKTSLTQVISVIQQLIVSYKIVLAHDYHLPLKKFNPSQSRFESVCIRILELFLWQQRIMATRFQKLSSRDWKECNSVYFVLASLFDPAKARPMSSELPFYKASGIVSQLNQERTAESLFKSIQLFGLLDISNWPSNSIQAIEQYLEQAEPLVTVSGQRPNIDKSDLVLTYQGNAAPPCHGVTGEVSDTACYFDMAELKKKVKADIEYLKRKQFIGGENDKKRLSAQGAFEALEGNLGLLELFSKQLLREERVHERRTLYGSKIVNLYNGMAAAYKLLNNMKSRHPELDGNNQKFQDAVASHSTLLIDREANAEECQWHVINESVGGMLLKTVETKHMHAMEVGQLIAVRSLGEGVSQHAEIGYITRLDRAREGEVDVAIVRISSQAQAVTIMEPGMENNTVEQLPGILVKDLSAVWQILLPKHAKYVSGTPAIIRSSEGNIPVRLGNNGLAKTGFVSFEVRSPALK